MSGKIHHMEIWHVIQQARSYAFACLHIHHIFYCSAEASSFVDLFMAIVRCIDVKKIAAYHIEVSLMIMQLVKV